ncbi:Canalicular multispecific organic anion transporter 2 [Nymphon striatum]|nr:Canalicular multispecific organic anion transporter 2 [Nymphon striatum]
MENINFRRIGQSETVKEAKETREKKYDLQESNVIGELKPYSFHINMNWISVETQLRLFRIYIRTSNQLRRLQSVTQSPIFSNFAECVSGTTSIRAYQLQDSFIRQTDKYIDIYAKVSFHVDRLSLWMTFLTQLLGSLLVFLAALFAVLARSTLNPGSAALAITYSERITRSIDGFITSLSGLENGLVAVERILEYSKVEQEDAWKKVNNERKDDWPNSGEIEFKNFETKYRPNLDPVLKKISFKINPSEKIGICGRTGSGKSSLTLSLFRIIESTNGCIEIDGVDISKIGLHDLRSVLTIIPQDPVLFNGSLRINLDPFEKNTDEELWYVLELTNLKSYIDTVNNGLDYMIAENGENLSVGQRQLVCLARALLRKSKILVLDEATASVDLGTDDIIQETIRTAFKNHTVITIAHRLNTIMDSTRILVLEDGCIKEFDSPQVLLSNKDSSFYKLAKDANLV